MSGAADAGEVAHAGLRGASAAMAMTGAREFMRLRARPQEDAA